MDTSGLYPQMGDNDPLYEVADYSQAMKTALSPRYKNITSYGNLYQAKGAPFTTPRWVREGKMIKLEGVVGTTSSTIAMSANSVYDILNVPTEPTPAGVDKMFHVATTPAMGNFGTLYVRASGLVQFVCPGFASITAANFAISLDNVCYYANTTGFVAV